MAPKLIIADVWRALTEEAKRNKKPAHVAVAYFSKGAADLLPLPPKSRLVVDASEAAVKGGQTHPADLRRMRRRKVDVYSVQNLHAKVFVFGRSVFIGSANVSKYSAKTLQEAVVRLNDIRIVRAARSFINDLCLEPLGPAELKRLQKLYRPPRFVAGRSEARKKRKHRSGFAIEAFYWPSPSPFRTGQMIVEVFKSGHGRTVSPPGHVIHTRPYREGNVRKTLVYFEHPNYEWEPLSGLDKETKKVLSRGGNKNQPAIRKILRFWQKRGDAGRLR